MSYLIDIFSTFSLLGIWPRFIEPRLLKTTHLTWHLFENAKNLAGLKIVHLSDLHFHRGVSQKFLNKIVRCVRQIEPDVIVFTGDFLCYSRFEQPERLASFLNQFKAPLGCYCSLGNHDYSQYVSLNRQGIYDLLEPPNPISGVMRGVRTFFSSSTTSKTVSPKVFSTPLHEPLCELIRSTSFQLLNNETITIPIGLNITGLGDLALGRCLPQIAFKNYNTQYPGLVLSHNPDSIPELCAYPGDWILSGHTHGEQIHIPWPKWGRKLSRKLARLENSNYTRGLFVIGNKHAYINRGLGCHKPFRLFSPPEVTVIEIKNPQL